MLKFHSKEVKLEGKNLKPIYEGLAYQRISRVEAAHRGKFTHSDKTIVTEVIMA